MSQYDLIVIGSGPAGQRAAIQGAKSGKKVALIERREVIGGVCINTGTIPSKTMREAVLHLSGYNYQNIYGVSYRVKEKITMADLAFRVQHVIKTEIDVTTAQLVAQRHRSVDGGRQFQRSKHDLGDGVRGTNEITGDNIVIGTGTKPAASGKVKINGQTIINSDQVLEMQNLPRR
jgi:NAD(P) transhydrogenase